MSRAAFTPPQKLPRNTSPPPGHGPPEARRSPCATTRVRAGHAPRHPYAGVAAIFRSALKNGQPPHVFEDGGQRRDFIHVTDIARANLAAVLSPGAPGTVTPCNIATGQPYTILDMATELASAMSSLVPQVTGLFRGGDVRHVTARARNELGFTAEVPFTQRDEGLRDGTIAPLDE